VKLNDLLPVAEQAFSFLLERGFVLRARSPATTDSFRDGWTLDYHSDRVDVRVEYLEMQFNVLFTHGATTTPYLFLDRELKARRSGLYGDQFPLDELKPVLERVAQDIAQNYADVLSANSTVWARITRLVEAPATKKKFP